MDREGGRNMEEKTVYYEDARQDHTAETLALANECARREGIRTIVLASTTGATALNALELFKDTGIRLIVVPHQFDFARKGSAFPPDVTRALREAGHEVFFGTMLFHTGKLYASETPTLVANFLRCFSQGVKVCFEIVLMAADAGLAAAGETVLAVAGTGRGADTALVMQAASTQHFTRLRVNRILCKPLNEIRGDAAGEPET
jgi:hypothetical protein